MDRLTGVIQPYDWGDPDALAAILRHDPPGHPEAEYWLGSHPGGPGLLGPDRIQLDRAIDQRPEHLLGPVVAERFGGLPFLVKILAAAKPLSIQAHPSATQAAAGFAREERDGPDRDAPSRSYRDPNHKPEILCALTPFEARCGFRDPAATAEVLTTLGAPLRPVAERLAADGPADTAAALLRLDRGQARSLAAATVAAATELLAGDGPSGSLRAEMESTVEVGRAFPGDVGVVVALLLNHLRLEPGQALFLAAGNLHAYLGGVGIEVMANSDNVLRGGLTAKHIDVDELDAVVDRRWGAIEVLCPEGPVHTFRPPVPEFALTRLDSAAGPIDGLTWEPVGPEVVLVTSGSVELSTATGSLALAGGEAGFITPPDGPYRMVDRGPGATMAWRIAVGCEAAGNATGHGAVT